MAEKASPMYPPPKSVLSRWGGQVIEAKGYLDTLVHQVGTDGQGKLLLGKM